jgi:hypothetical protein
MKISLSAGSLLEQSRSFLLAFPPDSRRPLPSGLFTRLTGSEAGGGCLDAFADHVACLWVAVVKPVAELVPRRCAATNDFAMVFLSLVFVWPRTGGSASHRDDRGETLAYASPVRFSSSPLMIPPGRTVDDESGERGPGTSSWVPPCVLMVSA